MTWAGGVGSGNLLLGASEAVAAGSASLSAIFTKSMSIASGFIVQTATNIGGSAAAITGLPAFYITINFGGTDYVMPLYRKV